MDNGYTREEMKMHWETRKIFADDRLRVNATAVRVPVFYGHSEALHIETRSRITASETASAALIALRSAGAADRALSEEAIPAEDTQAVLGHLQGRGRGPQGRGALAEDVARPGR